MEPVIVRPKTERVPQAPQVANPPIQPFVVLVCESCGPTMHRFIVTRRAGVAAFEQVYACKHCHSERRYGLIG